MADQNTPRVKLPDIIQRKPVVPGPNSWLQSQQHQLHRPPNEDSAHTTPTNGDKHEHKPMPRPPIDEPPSPNARQQLKTYMQPVIPLISPTSNRKLPKNRAVTDPIAPKPLFSGDSKPSVTQLQKNYSKSKPEVSAARDGTQPTGQSPTEIRPFSEKAAKVLGLWPGEDIKRNMSPASVPAKTVPDPSCTSFDTPSGDIVGVARQFQSTPVPTRRYLRENGLPTPTRADFPDVAKTQVHEDARNGKGQPFISEEHTRTGGFSHPPRLGTYAGMGEVGLVEGQGVHRVESFTGIIENVASSNSNDDYMHTTIVEMPSPPSREQGPKTRGIMPSIVYTPSNYGAVWENDPAVGHLLPPLSPMPRVHPPDSDRTGLSKGSVQDMFRDNYGNSRHANGPPNPNSFNDWVPNVNFNRLPEYHNPFPTANSWASDSRGDSFTTTNPPLSALLPPLRPNHHSVNSVPSPPQGQQDFQRSGSVSAALTQIELTVHHHIDTAFGSLSRLIIDKHDRTIDQTIRRLEKLEETVSKGLSLMKGETKDLKKNIGNLNEIWKGATKSTSADTELMKGLEGKLQALENLLEENMCKRQCKTAEVSFSEPDSDRQQCATSHRRTESAHGALAQAGQRQQYQSSGSRSSNSACQSGTSSKSHHSRSNTLNGQPTGRQSDEKATRREYYAELGATIGEVPDLKNHPAYAGVQQGHNDMPMTPSGLPFENPSLSDGRWYQQAYGQNR